MDVARSGVCVYFPKRHPRTGCGAWRREGDEGRKEMRCNTTCKGATRRKRALARGGELGSTAIFSFFSVRDMGEREGKLQSKVPGTRPCPPRPPPHTHKYEHPKGRTVVPRRSAYTNSPAGLPGLLFGAHLVPYFTTAHHPTVSLARFYRIDGVLTYSGSRCILSQRLALRPAHQHVCAGHER